MTRFLLDTSSAPPVLPHDERPAEWHAGERARLERPPSVHGQTVLDCPGASSL